MSASLKDRLQNDVKDAMRARAKQTLGTLRLIMAELKRREVDERIELSDQDVLLILEKMVKQRRDSLSQYLAADRQDLADQEQFELDLIAHKLHIMHMLLSHFIAIWTVERDVISCRQPMFQGALIIHTAIRDHPFDLPLRVIRGLEPGIKPLNMS